MVNLESFARLQARLRRPFARREDVLREANLDEDGLRMESAHWSALMASSEATAMRQKYREAYARASAAEFPQVAPSPPAASSGSSTSSPPPPLPTAPSTPPPISPRLDSVVPEAPVEPAEAPRRYVASFMQSPLMNVPSGPIAAQAITPSGPMPRAPATLEPIQPALQPPLAPPLLPPLPVAAPPLAPPVITAPPPPAVAMPAKVPLAQRGTSPVGRMREIMNAGPTPFAGTTTPEQLEKLRGTGPKSEPQPTSGRGKNATMMGKLDDGTTAPGKTLPFAKGGGNAAFPDLTVDRYAALAAELQAKGPTKAVLARYDIASAASLVALNAEHERRFAADPQLRARFEERRSHFLAFMAPTR